MIKNNPVRDNTGLLIRMDDIAEHMNWALMQKCEKLFNDYDIKPLLGIIPKNQDRDLQKYEKKDSFWDQVRNWQSQGWEISMHGFNHVYDTETYKKDFFGYGGKSEFYGHNIENQKSKIKKGLEIFNNEQINIRSFFAPNHTYDLNTFKALKENGINIVIDGYGLLPYEEFNIKFIPQLFYKEKMLPFGIQSTQVHINYMNEDNFNEFRTFIKKNYKKIINFDSALHKINNNIFSKCSRIMIEKTLKAIRSY